jgi:fructose/tagatose bisphosphate aldolase
MTDANREGYAVGCFETWSMDSLMAVADAAENMGSPVILGFTGSHAPDPSPAAREHLSQCAEIGLDVCRRLRVPACLSFKESADLSSASSAIELGFNLVRHETERVSSDIERQILRGLASWARHLGSSVESRPQRVAERAMTDPVHADQFIRSTGVEALIVDVVQHHHDSSQITSLDVLRLDALGCLPVSLVLDEPFLLTRKDLRAAVEHGVRKVNVGKVLSQMYVHVCRKACVPIQLGERPFDTAGVGFRSSLLPAARFAIQQTVEDYMRVLGSAERAPRPQFPSQSSKPHPAILVAR